MGALWVSAPEDVTTNAASRAVFRPPLQKSAPRRGDVLHDPSCPAAMAAPAPRSKKGECCMNRPRCGNVPHSAPQNPPEGRGRAALFVLVFVLVLSEVGAEEARKTALPEPRRRAALALEARTRRFGRTLCGELALGIGLSLAVFAAVAAASVAVLPVAAEPSLAARLVVAAATAAVAAEIAPPFVGQKGV